MELSLMNGLLMRLGLPILLKRADWCGLCWTLLDLWMSSTLTWISFVSLSLKSVESIPLTITLSITLTTVLLVNRFPLKMNLTSWPLVMHGSFYILRHISTKFTPLVNLGILVSAFCHDVDHTGRNNLFEVNSNSRLALRYHDKSVIKPSRFEK